MTKSDKIKIINNKIKANNAQYNINRLNAEIPAFSEGDLDKYEFLTRKDLKYKPNALDKAKFEFSPLGKAFNQGLDKKAENYKEEGAIKLLKDIRDRMVGLIDGVNNRNNGGDDNNRNNGDDDDEDDDDRNNGSDKIAETDSIDLSWMNNSQLNRHIAPEVFVRYDRNKDSFELFTLRTFIDNINNEHVKNKKDAREEFKIVKKNVKSEALKEIVKDLEQAILGDNDNDDNDNEELKKTKELDRRFKNLISKKRCESLREYLKESEDSNPQDRVNALRKKLNNLPKTSSDSEDNQISDFVDKVLEKVSKEIVNDNNNDSKDKVLKKVSKEIANDNNNDSKDKVLKKVSKEIANVNNNDSKDKVLKKVSKEIVNDDNKDNGGNISLKSNQKPRKNITEQLKSSENLLDKEIRDAKRVLELAKKRSKLNAKSIAETNKMGEELRAKNKDREEYGKKLMKYLKNITQKRHKGRLKK